MYQSIPTGRMREQDIVRMKSLVNAELCLMDYEILCGGRSATTQFEGVKLGPIDVYRYGGLGCRRGSRQLHHIRADRVSDYVICVPLQSSSNIYQGGGITQVIPGQFAVLSLALPFQASIGESGGTDAFSSYQARVAGTQLRDRVPAIDNYCNRPIQIRSGMGKIMQSLFELSLEEGVGLSKTQSLQLGAMLTDMVANSLDSVPELAGGDLASSLSPQMRTLEKAKTYIESNLSNPDLDVTMIAEHCHVSIRTLQAAFSSDSLTAVSYVRERRLHYCRKALKNAALRDKSITQIALTWGFNDPAYFSHAYKALYGVAPSQERSSITEA